MILATRTRRLAAIAGSLAFLAVSNPASAQEVAESAVTAARAAIGAMRTTEQFDIILPQAAQALKNELIQKNPDLQQAIIEIVDQTALSMAARRGDLEREAALAYARVFTESELTEISTFYASPTGQKLIEDGPIVMREILQAADIWQRGIARDLAQEVARELQKRTGVVPEGTEEPAAADE